jgi:hypothetical protein
LWSIALLLCTRFRPAYTSRNLALHLVGDDQKIGRVAREAVNRWDDDDIAGAKGGYQLAERGPLGSCARDLFAEHLFASGGAELGKLAGEVLGVGRDAGIAENRARNLHQRLASRKSNSINILILMHTS